MPANVTDSDRIRMEEIVGGLPTKSARIRALHNAGFSRTEIANFLDIRYQHVRNVLVAPVPKKERSRIVPTSGGLRNQRPRMDEVVEGLETKADKIRALHRAGYERSEVAEFLGIRYQHVYNVLKRSKLDKPPSKMEKIGDRLWAHVGADGSVVIPEPFCSALGLAEGSTVQLHFKGDEVRVIPRDVVVRRVQQRVRKYIPEGVSLVDELIAERRREVEREERGE